MPVCDVVQEALAPCPCRQLVTLTAALYGHNPPRQMPQSHPKLSWHREGSDKTGLPSICLPPPAWSHLHLGQIAWVQMRLELISWPHRETPQLFHPGTETALKRLVESLPPLPLLKGAGLEAKGQAEAQSGAVFYPRGVRLNYPVASWGSCPVPPSHVAGNAMLGCRRRQDGRSWWDEEELGPFTVLLGAGGITPVLPALSLTTPHHAPKVFVGPQDTVVITIPPLPSPWAWAQLL